MAAQDEANWAKYKDSLADIKVDEDAIENIKNANSYSNLTPAERSEMTTAEKIAAIKAEREARMLEAMQERAASNPMFDPSVRPQAPGPSGNMIYYYSWIGGATSGEWQLFRAPNSEENIGKYGSRSFGGETQQSGLSSKGANALIKQPRLIKDANGRIIGYTLDGDTVGNANGASVDGNYSGDGTKDSPLLSDGKPYTGTFGGTNYVNGVAQGSSTSNNGTSNGSGSSSLTMTDIETKARRTAQQDFRAALGELGLADLADEVDRMIKEDFTVSQIKLELPKTQSYINRFPGMKALRDAGRAISEATYIANERGYLQTLRAYGLDTAILGSRSQLGTYISNEVSPREFEERVNLASTRVKENPDVIAAFKSYYPEADQSGVITYLLNPKAGMDVIKKQVRVSEIGAAATKAGFAQQISADYAGTLIGAVGESNYAQISNEFQRARQLANSQRRLAQIENQAYSDLEAVSAVVGDDVTAALASERRAAREVSRFGTRGGLTGSSLGTTVQI